jgi:uncharacterized protein (TIGR04255 family)
MPQYESFTNPPVEEAIITMRVPPFDDPEALARTLAASERERYPVFEIIDPDLEPVSPDELDGGSEGYRLVSPSGHDVIRITERAFSFHRLRPYEGWNPFVQRAREAWSAFSAAASPEGVQSLHLRYLNELVLPEPIQDWGEYLLIRATIPHALERGLTNYMVTLNLEDSYVPARATVTQIALRRDEGAAIILDTDVRALTVFPGVPEDERMWRTLERMREYKNRVFFEGLTERAKEMFR